MSKNSEHPEVSLGRMSMDNKPVVHEYMEELVREEVWGSVTFNFEAGIIKTIHQNLVWKMKDLTDVLDPSGETKRAVVKADRPPLKRKRLIIRPGVVPSGSNMS
jgi:superfamily II helicase